MKRIARLLAALAGFGLGVALSIVFVGWYVRTSYACPPGVSEPCDVGGFVGIGLVIYLAPLLGLAGAAFGYWLALRRQRRKSHLDHIGATR